MEIVHFETILTMPGHEMASHISIFVINLLLWIFAKPLIRFLEPGQTDNQAKVRILRFMNVSILALQLLDLAFTLLNVNYQNVFNKIGLSIFVVYTSLYLFSLFAFFVRKRFGSSKKLDDKDVYFETYASRLINIFALFFVIFGAVYTVIKIWGADSMLETTGILGIFVAFMAFTSSVWAPDIISGLIILNSQLLEDGDVVSFQDTEDYFIISKVSFIYVILFDVTSNHRTLVKNSQFLQGRLENLSRLASTDGVRQVLTYKVGYPDFSSLADTEREQAVDRYYNRINRMFGRVNEIAKTQDAIKTNNKRDFEWALTQTGDFALEFSLWVYLDRIPNTKVTSTVRKHLSGTIFRINELVHRSSIMEGVDLATPNLSHISVAALPEKNIIQPVVS